jgi:hypothetical protein
MKLFAAVFLFHTLAAFAMEIDLALIQFPESKTSEALNESLAKVNLAEITNSNRTMTKERVLQGGAVLFTQRVGISPFASSTRLGDFRADVSGTYKNGRLDVEITISEGVDAGMRTFIKKIYQGSADMPLGTTRVLSLRSINKKKASAEKGRMEIRESETSTALIASVR